MSAINFSHTKQSGINQKILQAIHQIQFGSVEIVIHDGRVVQLERREKIRFNEEGAEK